MPMTKSEIAATLAEKVGISKKQAVAFFEAQAELALKQAKNQFVIPGLGKIKLTETPAREITLRFPPERAGEKVKKPKSKKLKFMFAKAAKDAVGISKAAPKAAPAKK